MALKLLISLTVFLVIGASVKLCGQECKQAMVSGEVRGEESYSRVLGDSLEFRLRPLKGHWGWTVSVSPIGSEDDWTFPVTFPLRNGESQTFGTGYGTTAQKRLKWPAEVFFLLSPLQYKRLEKRATETLNSSDQRAAGKYIAEVNRTRVGRLTIEATDYDKTGPPEEVTWMRFKATVVVPKTFPGAADLRWSVVRCPGR